MKTKILLVLFSMGTFNYFLAFTHDFHDIQRIEDQRKISTQILEEGLLWTLGGNVSILNNLPDGDLKVLLYPELLEGEEIDILHILKNQPIAEVAIDEGGQFIIKYLEEGRYHLLFIIDEEVTGDRIPLEARAIGGIDLQHVNLDGEMELQVAISFQDNKEWVYK